MNALQFIKTTIKDYRIGAVTQSSKYVVEQINNELSPKHAYIVEYGAGDGVITKKILKSLPPHGRIVAIELNKDFIHDLKNINDERLSIRSDDVRSVAKHLSGLGLPRIEAVISGIPFSFLNAKEQEEIIKNTYEALAPGGIFLVYQFSPLILPTLKKYFSRVKLQFAPLNFPPYFIMKAEK